MNVANSKFRKQEEEGEEEDGLKLISNQTASSLNRIKPVLNSRSISSEVFAVVFVVLLLLLLLLFLIPSGPMVSGFCNGFSFQV